MLCAFLSGVDARTLGGPSCCMVHSLRSFKSCGVHFAPLHQACHCHVTTGHLGFDKCLASIVFCILLCEAEAGRVLVCPPFEDVPCCCSCYIGYVGGLATTIVVMNVFSAAQPALLYIVPAVVGTSLGHAAINKEFNQVGLA